MNYISATECEIILIGAQSATISYDSNNINQFTPYQNIFLNATLPDVVILMVSPHDTIDYISRTIKYIESSIDTCVMALCLFPVTIKESFDWRGHGKTIPLSTVDLIAHRDFLKKELNKSTYILGVENDMGMLVNDIIEFF